MSKLKRAPAGNTGAVVQAKQDNVGIGWLTLTFKVVDDDDLMPRKQAILEKYTQYFLDNVVETGIPVRGYQTSAKTISGTILAWTPKRKDFMLSITQSAIERISIMAFIFFCWSINRESPNVTRLDIYVDEHSGNLDMDSLALSINNGCYVGRAKSITDISRRQIVDGRELGRTINFGSRTSTSYARFYDKAQEQKVDFHWVRCELELKGDQAAATFQLLLDAADLSMDLDTKEPIINYGCLVDTIKGIILGKIDFKLPDTATRTNNRTRCEFWEKVFMNIEQIRDLSPAIPGDIERVREWFESAVAPSLALLIRYFGDEATDWLVQVVAQGESKLTPRQIELLRREGK